MLPLHFYFIAVLFSALPVLGLTRGNERIPSFIEAKKFAAKVYEGHERTIYCGCPYEGKKIDLAGCGYKPKFKNVQRANRMEWEHMVPANKFGQQFASWKEGHPQCLFNSGKNKGKHFKGRKCAEKASEEFNRIEADLYNLAPSVGEINQLRGDLPMGEVVSLKRVVESCDFIISKGKAQPRKESRGEIARAYLYMTEAYPDYIKLSKEDRDVYLKWNKEFPVSEWEKERARRIEIYQGNMNIFIKGGDLGTGGSQEKRVLLPVP